MLFANADMVGLEFSEMESLLESLTSIVGPKVKPASVLALNNNREAKILLREVQVTYTFVPDAATRGGSLARYAGRPVRFRLRSVAGPSVAPLSRLALKKTWPAWNQVVYTSLPTAAIAGE